MTPHESIELAIEKSNRLMRLVAFLLSILVIGMAIAMLFGDQDSAHAIHTLFTTGKNGMWV